MLHPEFKLEYFKKAKWAASWIETTEQIVREEWLRKWKGYSAADEEEDIEVVKLAPVCNHDSRLQ